MIPKVRTVYISGPMTGLDQFNFPAFFAAEEGLLEQGFSVINPARLGGASNARSLCMRIDIEHLVRCDAIYMLKNWQKSEGASLELSIATHCAIPVFFEEGN